VRRLDREVQRMYGVAGQVEYATTVNDGPRVNAGRTAPVIPSLRADRPQSVLIFEPVVHVSGKGMTVEWAGELGALLAKRLTPGERRDLCKALGARLCMDAYRVAYEMGEAEGKYLRLRADALRAR
jgi:hypothetical protein